MAQKGKHTVERRLINMKKIFIVVIITIFFAAIALAVSFQILKEKPEISGETTPTGEDTPPISQKEDTVNRDQIIKEDEMITPLTRIQDNFTFLIAASDQSSGNADTIIVIRYDSVNKTVGMISIPRDTLIDPATNPANFPKINSTYLYGIEALKASVSDLLGIPIDYYLTIKTDAFIELVDVIGGVDFDIPVHMSYDDPLQNLSIHFEPGMQHLSGIDALGVCRLRYNQDGTLAYPDYDIGRTRTQQAMLKVIAQKVLTQPQKFQDYIRIFLEYCDTDLSFGNMLWLAESAIGLDIENNIETATLSGNGEVTYSGTKYCYQLYPEEALELINSIINPYILDRTLDDVHIFSAE